MNYSYIANLKNPRWHFIHFSWIKTGSELNIECTITIFFILLLYADGVTSWFIFLSQFTDFVKGLLWEK